jgi:hypothetical protein
VLKKSEVSADLMIRLVFSLPGKPRGCGRLPAEVPSMGSASHAAACIQTILGRADSTKIAMEFYHDRQMSSFQFHKEQTGKFSSEAASFYGTSFWLRRSSANQHTIHSAGTDHKLPLPVPEVTHPIANLSDQNLSLPLRRFH